VAIAAVAWHALRAHGSTTSPDEQIETVALEPVADPIG
jgi:hypothetical protein